MLPSNTSDFELKNPQARKSGGPGAGLFLTLGLLVVLIAVIGFAVTRLPTGTLSRPVSAPAAATAPTAAAVANGVTADAATQQAIQDVIQRLDDAQAEAAARARRPMTGPESGVAHREADAARESRRLDGHLRPVRIRGMLDRVRADLPRREHDVVCDGSRHAALAEPAAQVRADARQLVEAGGH